MSLISNFVKVEGNIGTFKRSLRQGGAKVFIMKSNYDVTERHGNHGPK